MTSRIDLSVGQRLAVGFGVIAAVVVLLAVVAIAIGAGVRAEVTRQVQEIEPRVDAAEALERVILHKAIAVRAYVISRDAPELQALGRVREEAVKRLRQLESLPQDAEGRALLDAVVSLKAAYGRAVDGMLDQLRKAGDTPSGSPPIIDAETAMSRSREALLAAVRRYQERELTLAREARDRVVAAVGPLALMLPLAAVFVLLVSGATIALVSRSIRAPASRIVAAARALAAGDYAPALDLDPDRVGGNGHASRRRDELVELARGFARMANLLRRREERLTARTRVAAALASSLQPGALASAALAEAAEHLRGEVGVVYAVSPDDGVLQPLATRALDGHLARLRVGEGVPGQAAADRCTYVVRDIPGDTPFQIQLGIEQVPPRWVAATPLVTRDRVVGVLVLAGLGTLADDGVEFLEDAAARLAVGIDNAQAHAALARLTAELHDANELLQAQNEELQAQGEELQQQNEALQAQGEELQAQAEELQAQADQLQEHRNELERRNEELARAERRKDEFLAMLGHELRNPLGAIITAVGLLRADGSRADDAPAVEVIARQARHLTRLVDDLLDVSRVTHGAIGLSVQPLDLGALVARTIDTVRGALAMRGRRIAVHTDPVWIEGDETRVEQIVSNLLTNAVKYTSADGRIAVTVARDGDGDTAVLRVQDDGVGISPELLPHIFDLFVQQARSHDRARGGLGVGLTLVRHLVELHGGTVEAASSGVGKGATFTVRLPAVAPRPSMPAWAPAATARTSCSIVVAEDNADAREVLGLLLARAGHQVHEADSGPGAVDTILAVQPDVALIDVDLPGFDGYDVARRVRARLSHTCLVALTGYGQATDRQRAREASFDEHLVKPVDPDDLMAAIDRLRARGRRAAAAGGALDPAADRG